MMVEEVTDDIVEIATMALLDHEERGDLAPGVDWKVDRAWTINIVREQMKKALLAITVTEEVTTRRAIEICMSRLRMHQSLASALAHHLAAEIADPEPIDDGDPIALRAKLLEVYDLANVDDSFAKRHLMTRISLIRERIRGAIL